MNKTSIERTINKVLVHVPTELENFEISQKASSNVDYFGHDEHRNFFIQFKSSAAKGYLFKDVDLKVITEGSVADSIGAFFAKNIKGKFEAKQVDYRIEIAR